jgi:hypothetical protein
MPGFVVDITGYIAGSKVWCYPTLEAPVAKDKKEGKREETNFSSLADKKSRSNKDNDDGQKCAGEPGQIEASTNSADKCQQDGDEWPGIGLSRRLSENGYFPQPLRQAHPALAGLEILLCIPVVIIFAFLGLEKNISFTDSLLGSPACIVSWVG